MSKLLDLIDRRIEQKMTAQDSIRYAPAEVLAVYKNEHDIIVRADVRLLANGTVIRKILNKSNEKLTVGQGVKVAYLTLPSAGWIAVANGEADPLRSGEGGGDIWNVETAAILNDNNFDSFEIAAEEMVEISPTTKFYYGAKPAFIVVQGMLCYFGSGNVSARTYPCQLDGSTEIFQSVIDNKEFFSASSFSSMTSPEHTLMSYPRSGDPTWVRYWSFTASTVQAVMKYQNNSLYVQQQIQPYSSRWTFNPGSTITELKFYDDLTAGEKAAVVENDKWVYRNTGLGMAYHNGSYELDQLADNFFVLPIVTAISDGPTTPNGYPAPYGYATVGAMPIIAYGEWIRGNDFPTATNLSGAGDAGGSYMPFKSQAEHDFAMGMTKRSEPQEENNGN